MCSLYFYVMFYVTLKNILLDKELFELALFLMLENILLVNALSDYENHNFVELLFCCIFY